MLMNATSRHPRAVPFGWRDGAGSRCKMCMVADARSGWSRPMRWTGRSASWIGLLLIAAGPLVSTSAQDAGYHLPLVLGPQAATWTLLAGQATRDENCLALRGGTRVALSEYRFGDCVMELDYRAQGPQLAEPIFYFRADVAPGERTVSGPSVQLRQASSRTRPLRWRRSHRAAWGTVLLWIGPGSTSELR